MVVKEYLSLTLGKWENTIYSAKKSRHQWKPMSIKTSKKSVLKLARVNFCNLSTIYIFGEKTIAKYDSHYYQV